MKNKGEWSEEIVDENKKEDEEKPVFCANCGKPIEYSKLSAYANLILNHKPACSYECNKALGQVKQ